MADRNLGLIGARLETAYGVVTELLGVETAGDERIEVWLPEVADVAEMDGGPPDGAATVRRGLTEAYRTDAPAPNLERSLVLLVLARATGKAGGLAPLLVDGVLALATARLTPPGATLPPPGPRPPGPPPSSAPPGPPSRGRARAVW